eukprot:c12163_g1_i1.p1 GENE.c12163_g1_i1~~c12163_g1_i1.p1  ORF type:complete len:1485 (-),score=444.47 c12163_g1_i1:163-4512(-)
MADVETWEGWIGSLFSTANPAFAEVISEIALSLGVKDKSRKVDVGVLAQFNDERSAQTIEKQLSTSQLLFRTANLIATTAQQHNRDNRKKRQNTFSKFSDTGGYLEQSFLSKPLDEIIGAPNANLRQTILREHSSTTKFTSTMYGVETTPKMEFEIVFGGGASELPKGKFGETDLGVRKHEQLGLLKGLMHSKISKTKGFELVTKEEVNALGLLEEEIGCLRLFTGPMSEHYNKVLRACSNGLSKVETGEKKIDEVIQLRQYTTTIHLISSGLMKLAHIQPLGKSFRAIGTPKLPECFSITDSKTHTRCGIEAGFVSCSTEPSVAIDWAGSGYVMEVQPDAATRGANLSWLSFYPEEKELCFPPCSMLEYSQKSRMDGSVVVLHMNLLHNKAATTIERYLQRRRNFVIELSDILHDDDDSENSNAKAKDVASVAAGLMVTQKKILHGIDQNWFNNDANFASALQGSLDLKKVIQVGLSKSAGDLQLMLLEAIALRTAAPIAVLCRHGADPLKSSVEYQSPLSKCVESEFGEGLEEMLRSSTFTVLDLSYHFPKSGPANAMLQTHIAKAIPSLMPSLTSLNISKILATDDVFSQLLDSLDLKKLPNLSMIDIDENAFTSDKNGKKFAAILRSGNQPFKQIKFTNSDLTNWLLSIPPATAFATHISSPSPSNFEIGVVAGYLDILVTLDLSGSRCGPSGLEIIAHHIQLESTIKQIPLKSLILSFCDGGDKGVGAIVEVIAANKVPNLKLLDIRNNNLGWQVTTKVATLKVEQNLLDHSGLSAFLADTNATKFSANSQQVSVLDMAVLGRNLYRTKLQNLDLRNSGCEHDQLAALIQGHVSNPKEEAFKNQLTSLNLEGNHNPIFSQLVSAMTLGYFPKLTELNIRRNNVDRSINEAAALGEMLCDPKFALCKLLIDNSVVEEWANSVARGNSATQSAQSTDTFTFKELLPNFDMALIGTCAEASKLRKLDLGLKTFPKTEEKSRLYVLFKSLIGVQLGQELVDEALAGGQSSVKEKEPESSSAPKQLKNPSITSLNISGYSADDSVVTALMIQKSLSQLRELNISGGRINDNKGVSELAKSKFVNLEGLILNNSSLRATGCKILGGGTALVGLKLLSVSNNKIEAEGAKAIARGTSFTALTSLDISFCSLGSEGADAIATSTSLTKLVTLNISNNKITDKGLMSLAKSPSLKLVTDLDVSSNNIQRGVQALATSQTMTQLKVLALRFNQVEVEGVSSIASGTAMANLHTLVLNNNNFGAEAAYELSQGKALKNLTDLNVANNRIDDVGLENLANSPVFKLRSLDVTGCSLRAKAGELIAKGNAMGGLVNLELSSNELGSTGVRSLCQGPGLLYLEKLGLRGNRIADEAVKFIANAECSFSLNNLDLSFNSIQAPGMEYLLKGPSMAKLKYLGLTHQEKPAGAPAQDVRVASEQLKEVIEKLRTKFEKVDV